MEFPGKGTVQHTGTSDGVLRACGERAVYVYYGTQHCHPIGPVITARAGRQVLPVDVCPGREERASRAPQKRRTVNHRPINTAIASPSIEVQVGRWVKKPDSPHKRRTRRVRPLLSHVSRNDTKSHQKKGSTEEKTAETLWQEIDPALSAIAPRGPPLNGCLLPSSCLCVSVCVWRGASSLRLHRWLRLLRTRLGLRRHYLFTEGAVVFRSNG